MKEEINGEILNKEDSSAEKNGTSTASTLMKGATILAVAGIISKMFGAIFRIPLTNMIGAEGQSYYGAAYPVYQLFFVIASAGFPVAISRMVSERIAVGDHINAHKSFKLGLKVMSVISIIAAALCYFGAGAIARFYTNPGAEASIKAVSLALLLTPLAASFRGYFQGQQQMMQTAVSEIIEQMARVVVGLTLAYLFFRTNLEMAAAGATFGASAGMIAAVIALFIMYRMTSGKRAAQMKESVIREETNVERFMELLEIVIPITIGSAIMPLMMNIDAAIVMRRLQETGWSFSMSKTLYGLISGFCDPIVNLPTVFIDAITITMIPAVTHSFTLHLKDEVDENIKTGLKTMMIVVYPCAVGLIVLAQPILHMLFPTKIDEADLAIHTMQILAVSIVALAVMRTLSSCLQGIGKMNLPVINLFTGAVIKVFVTYFLVGIPFFNVNGAAIGSVCAYLTAAILNYRGLRKHADVSLDLSNIFIKPLWASLIMGASAIVSYKLLFMLLHSNTLATGFAILIAMVVYFVTVFITGAITREELELLPKGEMLYRLARKMHLIK